MSGGWVPRQHTVHRAVLELGESFRSARDLPSLLKVAADAVLGVIHTDVVAILEFGSDQKSLRGLAAAGIDSAASMRRISEQPDSWSSEAMRSGRTVVVRDLFHDRRFATDIPSASGGAQGGSRVMLSGITVSINQASDSPPPLAGERRVGAVDSIQAMASRQPPNASVLSRPPNGSRRARRSAAPRMSPVSPRARRGAASPAWITAAVG